MPQHQQELVEQGRIETGMGAETVRLALGEPTIREVLRQPDWENELWLYYRDIPVSRRYWRPTWLPNGTVTYEPGTIIKTTRQLIFQVVLEHDQVIRWEEFEPTNSERWGNSPLGSSPASLQGF